MQAKKWYDELFDQILGNNNGDHYKQGQHEAKSINASQCGQAASSSFSYFTSEVKEMTMLIYMPRQILQEKKV